MISITVQVRAARGKMHEVDVSRLVEYDAHGRAIPKRRFCSSLQAAAIISEGNGRRGSVEGFLRSRLRRSLQVQRCNGGKNIRFFVQEILDKL